MAESAPQQPLEPHDSGLPRRPPRSGNVPDFRSVPTGGAYCRRPTFWNRH